MDKMLTVDQIKTMSRGQLLLRKKDFTEELKDLFMSILCDYNEICTSNLIMAFKNMDTVHCILKLLKLYPMHNYYVVCSNVENQEKFQSNKYKLLTQNEMEKYVKCDIDKIIIHDYKNLSSKQDISEFLVDDYTKDYDVYIRHANNINEYIVSDYHNVFVINPFKLEQLGHIQGNHKKIKKLLRV